MKSKNDNEDLVRKNANLKDEIVELEDRLKVEKDKQVELRGIKDKANHNVYK